MAEYLSPGVYVEEIDAGPKPIEGVSTSTAGAAGVTDRGPTSGKPVLVTSFADFVRTFGGYLKEPESGIVNRWALDHAEGGQWWKFPLAVKGFFDNGGQRLYVKRVFSSQARFSEVLLGQGVVSEITQDAPATSNRLSLRHNIGIAVGSAVSVIASGFSIGNFTVTAYVGGAIELDNPLGQDVKGGRDFVVIFPRQATPPPAAIGDPDPRLTVRAKASGDWGGNEDSTVGTVAGNGLSVRVRPMIGATLKVLADPLLGGSPASTTVTVQANAGDTVITIGSAAGLAIGNTVLIGGRHHEVQGIAVGPPDQITINPAVPAGPGFGPSTTVRRLRRANDSGVPRLTINVRNASSLYTGALVELDNGTDKEVLTVASVSGDLVTLSANMAGQYFDDSLLRVIEVEVGIRYRRNQLIEAEETFSNLRLVDDGTANYIVTQINENSKLIDLVAGDGFAGSVDTLQEFPSIPQPAAVTDPQRQWADLTGGRDNLGDLSVDDFVGQDNGIDDPTGIQAFELIDEISICMVPGLWSSTIHSALIQHCEMLKDRFAILDPRDGLNTEEIREFREPLDTKYAALYYPWIEVRDPSIKRNIEVAPSGHMAGIYARVDVERGVHKAPANEVIRGITRIADDVTKREQDMLNPRNINVLRFFPGRGNRVWGARVVTSDSAWKYINVRRLFIFVEESIDEGTQFVVFEPNDEPLWARVRATITNFLTTVWRSGALQGAKPDEAFFVKCDRSTMTQDDIDNGRLICVIGIAPVKPAEFVIFRIQQKTLETTVS
ncbi:MAG: phage tail sheath C-terminal domain-containing protein [Blastocatellia bacterium]